MQISKRKVKIIEKIKFILALLPKLKYRRNDRYRNKSKNKYSFFYEYFENMRENVLLPRMFKISKNIRVNKYYTSATLSVQLYFMNEGELAIYVRIDGAINKELRKEIVRGCINPEIMSNNKKHQEIYCHIGSSYNPDLYIEEINRIVSLFEEYGYKEKE